MHGLNSFRQKGFHLAQGAFPGATERHPADRQGWACCSRAYQELAGTPTLGREGGAELGRGQGAEPTHPRLGPNPGQHLGLVIWVQDHKGHEGAVDVPPIGLGLLAVGLHAHAHLHAEGEGGLLSCWTDLPSASPLPTHMHTRMCTHTHALPQSLLGQSPTGRKPRAAPFGQCVQSTYCALGPTPVTGDSEMNKPVRPMFSWTNSWGLWQQICTYDDSMKTCYGRIQARRGRC